MMLSKICFASVLLIEMLTVENGVSAVGRAASFVLFTSPHLSLG